MAITAGGPPRAPTHHARAGAMVKTASAPAAVGRAPAHPGLEVAALGQGERDVPRRLLETGRPEGLARAQAGPAPHLAFTTRSPSTRSAPAAAP